MSPAIELELTDAPPTEVVAGLSQGLDDYNTAFSGVADRRPLAVLVRAPDGRVLGGLSGRTSLGLLFVELFHLPEHLRGNGLGTRILQMAEDEARHRGCRSAVLYTISFQAPEFYRRLGWQEFGRVPCNPPGTSRVFFSKIL